MRAPAIPLGPASLVLAVCLAGGASARAVPTATELLDRYTRGDFDGSVQAARHVSGPELAKSLEASGSRWIAADGDAAAGRRRVNATAFALEVAEAFRPADWGTGRRLYQWAFAEWSRVILPPTPSEHLWYETATALLQSADDWLLLSGRPTAAAAAQKGQAPPLLNRALARFPGDARFRLAAAVVIEGRYVDIEASFREMGRLAGAGARAIISPQDEAEYRRLADTLTELAATDLAVEASLHLGFVRMRLGQFDAALPSLAVVMKATAEPQLLFPARLFQGFCLERRGRLDEAAEAWRAALAIVPRAQSATTLLAGLLVKLDEPDKAQDLVERFFSGGAPAADPWRRYRLGDAWRLPSNLVRLREALR